MTGIFIKRGHLDTERDTRRGRMLWRHAGSRWPYDWNNASVRQETKDGCQPPEAGKDKKGIFFRNIRESMSLPTPWLWTFSLRNCETLNLYCFYPVFGTWYSSPRKLIQPSKYNYNNCRLLIIYNVCGVCQHCVLFILPKLILMEVLPRWENLGIHRSLQKNTTEVSEEGWVSDISQSTGN